MPNSHNSTLQSPSDHGNLAGFLLPALLLLSSACAGEPTIKDRTVTVACGSCVFQMPKAEGCPWAAELDGKHYLVQGAVPQDHISHAPEGICNMPRKAVIDGRIKGDKLIVSRMELLPAENVPAEPKFTPEDVH